MAGLKQNILTARVCVKSEGLKQNIFVTFVTVEHSD